MDQRLPAGKVRSQGGKQTMDAKTLTQSITSAIQDLANETDQARVSETLQRYLETVSKFHRYSWNNQLLIWIQRPDAQRVAGYQTWKQKFNRQVKCGEKGIAILAPCVFKPKAKADDTPDLEDLNETEPQPVTLTVGAALEDDQHPRMYFRVVYVFDVEQTEGEPLPEAPDWRDHEKDTGLENALTIFAKSKGIAVEISDDLGKAEGSSSGGKIRLLPTAGTRVFAHELAHELFEHCKPDVRANTTRQQREIEADAAAYVVVRHFGLSAESAPNYLALWRAAGKDILACLERVRGVAMEIIQAVEGGAV
jgi:hypothetical protein